MVTTFITINTAMAEYAKAVFAVPGKSYIKVPHTYQLYHVIANNMIKPAKNCVVPNSGNLEIALTAQSGGKCPQVNNYISQRTTTLVDQLITSMFWAHLHHFVDEYRSRVKREDTKSVFYIKDCVYMFLQQYNITAITEGALVKNYYRWTCANRRQLNKRDYNSTEKPRKERI